MKSINALSLAPDVNGWLTNSRSPRILHVFDSACNLINERREVLSVVTPQIGNGPFNLVMEGDVCFSEHLSLESPVSVFPTQLHLGDLSIHTADAKLWSPRPDWEMLHARKDEILNQLTKLPITNYRVRGLPLRGLRDTPFVTAAQGYSTASLQSLISNFSPTLAAADISSALTITSQLAGLGAGLTPAGDDFIMGAVLAAWIIHPPEIAGVLAEEITNVAAPLTTSLSAAWLRSVGRGEAGILWHEFFDALVSGNTSASQLQITKLLSVGHTSGADALAGFVGVLIGWADLSSSKIH